MKVELSCTFSVGKDAQCVAESREIEQQIEHLELDIAHLQSFLENIQQLKDSSVCVLKRSKENNELHECSDNNDDVIDIQDKIKLLDLVEFERTSSIMQLEKVVASDQIVFHSNLYLYGDWTNKHNKVEEVSVTRHDLTLEEENAKKGLTNGAKSLAVVKHILDFNSIDQSAQNVYETITQIVCREYEIDEERSYFLQLAITEFDLLDGDNTVCPSYIKIDESGESSKMHSNDKVAPSVTTSTGSISPHSYTYTGSSEDIELTQSQIEGIELQQQEVSIEQALESAEELNHNSGSTSLSTEDASDLFLITEKEHHSQDNFIDETQQDTIGLDDLINAMHTHYAADVYSEQYNLDEFQEKLEDYEDRALAHAKSEEQESLKTMEEEKIDAELNKLKKEAELSSGEENQKDNSNSVNHGGYELKLVPKTEKSRN